LVEICQTHRREALEWGFNRHTVAFGYGNLNAGIFGQVPTAILAGGTLARKARAAQGLDVKVPIEAADTARDFEV
jgi:hypothetical protein